MKLFFDARYIRTDYHDGISRYSTELGKAIAKLTDVTFLICDNEQKKFFPKKAKFITIHAPTSPKEPMTARILNHYAPDVVICPFQVFGAAGRKFKLVLTLHDLIYYKDRTPPKQLHPIIRAGWWLYHVSYMPQRLQLNSADIVATISHATQREIEQTKLTKRPIIVVPNAPQNLASLLKKPVTTTAPTNLIYMGSFMPYKNVETLIKGMKWLPNHTLHLLSKISASRKQALQQHIPKNANIVFYNGVSDEQYAALLANRGILVSASRFEGFGLPIAEALALGVPAVISDTSIFHEVAGNGALYFDVDDAKHFSQQVTQLRNARTRNRLIEKGQQHIQNFSWNASARELMSAVKTLL